MNISALLTMALTIRIGDLLIGVGDAFTVSKITSGNVALQLSLLIASDNARRWSHITRNFRM